MHGITTPTEPAPPAAPIRAHCGSCRFALLPRWATPGEPYTLPTENGGSLPAIHCVYHTEARYRLFSGCSLHQPRGWAREGN